MTMHIPKYPISPYNIINKCCCLFHLNLCTFFPLWKRFLNNLLVVSTIYNRIILRLPSIVNLTLKRQQNLESAGNMPPFPPPSHFLLPSLSDQQKGRDSADLVSMSHSQCDSSPMNLVAFPLNYNPLSFTTSSVHKAAPSPLSGPHLPPIPHCCLKQQRFKI